MIQNVGESKFAASVEFWIPVKGLPKERPRMSKKSSAVYTPQKTKDFEKEVAIWVKMKLPKPWKLLEGAVDLTVDFHFGKPINAKPKRRFHTIRPDLDNLVKAVKDSLNGVVWKDDAQVCSLHTSKRFVYGVEENYIRIYIIYEVCDTISETSKRK